MAEGVNTGGLIKFNYEKGQNSKLSEERKNEIREAYARAEERKQMERRNRMLFWIAGIIALILASVMVWKLAF